MLIEAVSGVGGMCWGSLPHSITGSGTSTMLITFPDYEVGQMTLRITLDGSLVDDSTAITDLASNVLDGEAKGGQPGAYLATPGGSAFGRWRPGRQCCLLCHGHG